MAFRLENLAPSPPQETAQKPVSQFPTLLSRRKDTSPVVHGLFSGKKNSGKSTFLASCLEYDKEGMMGLVLTKQESDNIGPLEQYADRIKVFEISRHIKYDDPQGFDKLTNALGQFNKDPDIHFIAFESGGGLQWHMLGWAGVPLGGTIQRGGSGKENIQIYNWWTALFPMLVDLNKHVLISLHLRTKTYKNDKTGENSFEYGFSLPGQYSIGAADYFNCVCRLTKLKKNGRDVYAMLTEEDGLWPNGLKLDYVHVKKYIKPTWETLYKLFLENHENLLAGKPKVRSTPEEIPEEEVKDGVQSEVPKGTDETGADGND